ncbi:hypothetical protein BCR37DRAFT_391435 [Protomyces lactucae-debilis]|uniref:Vacuolar ATPase assembly protein VMA22 n=1 Tax=Protomyces lactucae-debilis TaxID=2754530 RepID=A0A1Y2FNV6_PROLT|nr:uncharacterized protein BCR37DRAFT_391435 [Protomyces lactucae-debilis]ORY85671.1 hypothetical protein BCR37DRAFT_391435 [Protomyces lactucae-debilis]
MQKAELDELILNYLDSVDTYSSCQTALAEEIAQAFVKLARARYLGTQVDTSSFKQTYDPHITTSTTVSNETSVSKIAVCINGKLSSAGQDVEPNCHRQELDGATAQKHGTHKEMESQESPLSNKYPRPSSPVETEVELSDDQTLEQLSQLHLASSSKPQGHPSANASEPASIPRKAKSSRRARSDPLNAFGAMPSTAVREAQQSFMMVVERSVAAINARRALEEHEELVASYKRLKPEK